jgi:hypothetical protein
LSSLPFITTTTAFKKRGCTADCSRPFAPRSLSPLAQLRTQNC